MNEQLQHTIKFIRGHDCINYECNFNSDACFPNGGGSHGLHGMCIKFLSKGPEGAVQFVVCTGWLPQKVERSKIGLRYVEEWGAGPAYPVDLGYHSKRPFYDRQKPIDKECEFCDGQPCYYDGSGLNAYDAMYALVNGGEGALWAFLDAYYKCVFCDEDYPHPQEFPFPKR